MANGSIPPGPEGQFISLDQAKTMTALYRAQKENILAPQYQGKDILSTCETFDRSIFDTILAEKDCTYLRVYFGMDPDFKVKVILVGVDSQWQDILPAPSQEPQDGVDGGSIGEEGVPCPPWCPVPPL